ncbi:MAG: AtpZ/AtpI family protein [Tyzzerella sp.]|nr:AtpZ/AtpI family protein [Tyzzerella sp.]
MKKVYRTLALISQLGISMIVPILLCTAIGVYLDEKFSLPLTIPLIVLGILAGGRNVYVLVRDTSRQIAEDEGQ